MSYYTKEENFRFEKAIMSFVRDIVGREFKRGSKQQDCKEATDLIDRFGTRLGVRVRRDEKFRVCRDGKDLTFRDRTEIYKLRKLVKRYPHFYYFYGFGDANSAEKVKGIPHWLIINLRKGLEGLVLQRSCKNKDRKTALLVYEILDFCVVKN